MSQPKPESLEVVNVSNGGCSHEFAVRLVEFFSQYLDYPRSSLSEIWQGVTGLFHTELTSKLIVGDHEGVSEVLGNIYHGATMFGLDVGTATTKAVLEPFRREWLQMLVMAATNSGAMPMFNVGQPESPEFTVDGLLTALESTLGFTLNHPCCAGMPAVKVGDRLVPIKLLNAACIATSLKRHCTLKDSTVLEIGAGAGFMAYLLTNNMEVPYYFTIDIPTVSVIQASIIASAIGEEQIWLNGENTDRDMVPAVSIVGPEMNGDWSGRVDIVINQDSLPEMPKSIWMKYSELICKCLKKGGIFISVNHESSLAGQVRVFDMMQRFPVMKQVCRSPFWAREGYVEEVWVKT